MKQVVFRYGIFAALAIIVFSSIHLYLLPRMSAESAEVAGYLSITLSMIFVFMGIRYYRDKVNSGFLSFGQGLKVGVLIILVPSVAFGLLDLLYTEVINPAWADDYYSQQVAKLTKSTPADQLPATLEKLRKQQELFGNPVIQFSLMAVTVFIIGFIVTIISSLALSKKKTVTSQV